MNSALGFLIKLFDEWGGEELPEVATMTLFEDKRDPVVETGSAGGSSMGFEDDNTVSLPLDDTMAITD